MHITRTSIYPLAVTGAIALALTMASCGDDDDASQADAKPKAAVTDDGQPATDREQLEQLLRDVQVNFINGRGDLFCDNLTAAGQAEVVRYGKAASLGGDSCAAVSRQIAQQSRQAGLKQKSSRLVSARVNGSKAIALVRDAGRAPVRMRFVRVDGEWKLPSPGLEAALTGKSP